MAENPIKTPLPADLPEDWTGGQTVAPTGAEVGLSEQHGYNYLMEQVNAAQTAAKEIGEAFSALLSTTEKGAPNGVATLGQDGKLVQDVDGGTWDTEPVEAHNRTALAHTNLRVDGNSVAAADGSTTLEEHMRNPLAHQNLVIDGNAGK